MLHVLANEVYFLDNIEISYYFKTMYRSWKIHLLKHFCSNYIYFHSKRIILQHLRNIVLPISALHLILTSDKIFKLCSIITCNVL